MDTTLLRSFVAVVRQRGFTAAARDLGFVQSTITGHVQALERQFGTRLVDRLPGDVVTTDAGARLFPLAEELLRLEDRLAEEVRSSEDEPVGTVRLAAPESLCAYRLPALVAQLRERAPGVRLSLSPAGTAGAVEAVRRGTVELALALESEMQATGVDARRVGSEPVLVLAAAPMPGPVTWGALVSHDALLLEEGCSYSDSAVRALTEAGQPAERRTRFGSIEAVRRCVAAGLGVTVLPQVTVASDLASGALVALDGLDLPAPAVHLLSRTTRTPSAAARVVAALLPALWQH